MEEQCNKKNMVPKEPSNRGPEHREEPPREREDQDRRRMEGEYSSPKAGQRVGVEIGLIPGRLGIRRPREPAEVTWAAW